MRQLNEINIKKLGCSLKSFGFIVYFENYDRKTKIELLDNDFRYLGQCSIFGIPLNFPNIELIALSDMDTLKSDIVPKIEEIVALKNRNSRYWEKTYLKCFGNRNFNLS